MPFLRLNRVLPSGVFALFLLWGSGPRPACAQPAAAVRQPVYIHLFLRVDDHVNVITEEERRKQAVDLVERTRKQFPEARVSLLLQFTGVTALEYSLRDGGRTAEQLRDLARRGVVEFGYDGSDEPTYLVRPTPSFRAARTAADRWLARAEPARWFLTEFKDPLTGEPDPQRPGGLKLAQDVFGPLASVSGHTTMELGGDSEYAHHIRRIAGDPVLPGIPESSTWPARNLHGFGGSVAGIARSMSPADNCAPEVFWQDNLLRFSDNSGAPVKVVRADQGPEAFMQLIEKLDRSRPHVIKVQLSPHAMYIRPEADAGLGPARYAYDHPKVPYFAPAQLYPAGEVAAAHSRQEALLQWLAQKFVPANPGSRFVSTRDLKAWAGPSYGFDVSRDEVRSAASNLLGEWRSDPHPPDYAYAGNRYFSLADMFQLLATSLADRHRTGALPPSVRLSPVYGPLEMLSEAGAAVGEITPAAVARECARIAPELNDGEWRPVPRNAVPTSVAVDGIRLNAAQFLRLMAQAFLNPEARSLKVEMAHMFSSAGFVYPRTRPMRDEGAMWTLKPAPLSLERPAGATR